jgi:hypothetical protein
MKLTRYRIKPSTLMKERSFAEIWRAAKERVDGRDDGDEHALELAQAITEGSSERACDIRFVGLIQERLEKRMPLCGAEG